MLTDWNEGELSWGHNARRLGDFWIWVQYSRKYKGSEERKGIRIASLNLRSGRAGGLEALLRALQQGHVDVRVLQETKLTRGIHTRYGEGYSVWETDT